MADSEQQPLLPFSRIQSWQTRLAHLLESQTLHKVVISLIITDASCVLADLGYTFLLDSCSPAEGSPPAWLAVLAHISLAITTLFLCEIPLALCAFGLTYYEPWGPVSHASLHLFDSTIIVTTFVLEVILKGREKELAGLLVILRLWRLVKLVGGVAVGAGEIAEDSLAEVTIELEAERATSEKLRHENADLRARLAHFGGADTDSWH